MTELALGRRSLSPPAALFVATVFSSAALVFVVQPMVAKLILPLLGGSSSVWNTCTAFFQLALLAGYAYAHLLQRVRSVRAQALIHFAALAIAAVALPLRIHESLGPPSSAHPAAWLLGELALSIGAPFAVLSATAPLTQAWYARTIGQAEGKEPYALYAASNLGSFIALLAYPILIEPTVTVAGQRYGWSGGYLAFILLMGSLALIASRSTGASASAAAPALDSKPASWRSRMAWIALAAIPSSLMLGVTTYLTTDVASAPFLWVVPLAIYLFTFVIAFQDKPAISASTTLLCQAAAVAICALLLPFNTTFFGLQFVVHLAAFFFTALMCHQRLVSLRPDPSRLTEFYLCMSIGGVVGGAFNAFAAPVMFNDVLEYPLVLALACLARPLPAHKVAAWVWGLVAAGVVAALAVLLYFWLGRSPADRYVELSGVADLAVKALLIFSAVCVFLARRHALGMFAVVSLLSISAAVAADRTHDHQSWRSFFGVMKVSRAPAPGLGGDVKLMSHGTTLHGAQAQNATYRCRPLTYYAYGTPIGQVFTSRLSQRSALNIGAVGLGTGSVAAYVRPADRLTFFEIDPLVVRLATDPNKFSYTTECAKGPVSYVVGDARLTVAKQPDSSFDILLIDAFSSDAVPAHLLTVEAVKGYLRKLKPDGVLILHLSNRNLDLLHPAQAVAHAAAGVALIQSYSPGAEGDAAWESAEDAVIVAHNPQALETFRKDKRWLGTNPYSARPWTDDYTNLPGALYAQLKAKLRYAVMAAFPPKPRPAPSAPPHAP